MSKDALTNGHNGFPYYTKDDAVVSDTEATVEKVVRAEVTARDRRRLRTAAIVTSWISAIFSITTGTAAIVLGQIVHSESLFGYGLDGVLDSLSSVVVLWRLYESATSSKSETRDRRACIIVSVLFFVSAFSLVFKSINTIANQTVLSNSGGHPENGRLLTEVFSSCCGVIALVLASVKVYQGRRLDSRVLITDSITTFVGAAISFLGVLGLELYTNDEDVWYLDAVFGLCCGVFLFLFGLKLLVQMTCLYRVKEPLAENQERKP